MLELLLLVFWLLGCACGVSVTWWWAQRNSRPVSGSQATLLVTPSAFAALKAT